MKHIIKPALEFLKWDLRTTLAVILALAVFIGWSLAQTAVATFDFGTASSGEVASGAIHVKGAITIYPVSGENFTYGWQTTSVQEFSNKNVSDLLNRDYNGSSASNTFKIVGLDVGLYDVKFVVGDPESNLATRITLGGQAVDVVADKKIRSVVLTHEVLANEMLVSFSSIGGVNWGINAITITPTTGDVPDPSFKLSLTPAEQTVKAGGVAVFVVGLTRIDNYSSDVDLTINGLVSGITAEFFPSKITANGSSELQLKTSITTSPTTYEFLITAKGQDDANVVQNGVVKMVVQSSDIIVVPPVPGAPITGGDVVIVPPPVVSRSKAEIRADFKNVDEFVAEYQEKVIAGRKDIEFIEAIALELYGVPILQQLPEARTPLEGVLQSLVQAGLIQSAVDTAPMAPLDTTFNKNSFWDRFMRSLAPSAY